MPCSEGRWWLLTVDPKRSLRLGYDEGRSLRSNVQAAQIERVDLKKDAVDEACTAERRRWRRHRARGRTYS